MHPLSAETKRSRREEARGTQPLERSWSGRRGSNPRPTAWKAVTLPLSYSRLGLFIRGLRPSDSPARALARRFAGSLRLRGSLAVARSLSSSSPGRHSQAVAGEAGPPVTRSLPARPSARPAPAEARSRQASERRLVAREGLEPSKAQGRQIYSLLRLTAPQPRLTCVCTLRSVRWRPAASAASMLGAFGKTSLCSAVYGAQPAGSMRPATLELAEGFEPPTG